MANLANLIIEKLQLLTNSRKLDDNDNIGIYAATTKPIHTDIRIHTCTKTCSKA